MIDTACGLPSGPSQPAAWSPARTASAWRVSSWLALATSAATIILFSAQAQAQSQNASIVVQPTVTAPATAKPASREWQALSKRQKQALAPLSSEWHTLTAAQKQKWRTLAKNFLTLSDEEQMTLHARMRDWATLTPRQRNLARFNFNNAQSLTIQDKRAQWEAYQALTTQEKGTLSAGPKPPVKSAARSTSPPSSRLVRPPVLPVNASQVNPRVTPSRPVHPKTLLPQPF